MKQNHKRALSAAVAFLCYVSVSAHAETLNLPVSAGYMNSGEGSGCQNFGWPNGVGPKEVGASCDFEFPISLTPGRTVKQIEVVHATGVNGGAFITAFLGTVDIATAASALKFQWLSNAVIPSGTYAVSPLMKQTQSQETDPPVYLYPDAFIVQPNTMYRVVLHLEDGGDITGLRVTYQ